jgi:hypothetical protein
MQGNSIILRDHDCTETNMFSEESTAKCFHKDWPLSNNSAINPVNEFLLCWNPPCRLTWTEIALRICARICASQVGHVCMSGYEKPRLFREYWHSRCYETSVVHSEIPKMWSHACNRSRRSHIVQSVHRWRLGSEPIPVIRLGGPWACEKSRIPHCPQCLFTDGA